MAALLAVAPAAAADLQVAPPPPTPAADSPAGLSLGITAGETGFATHRADRAGVEAQWSVGGGVTFSAEGALGAEAPAFGPSPDHGAVRGRLSYGGGFETLGLEPGRLTPWLEGERAWSLDGDALGVEAVPASRLTFGLDLATGGLGGLSVSTGALRLGPDAEAGVEANAGLRLKF